MKALKLKTRKYYSTTEWSPRLLYKKQSSSIQFGELTTLGYFRRSQTATLIRTSTAFYTDDDHGTIRLMTHLGVKYLRTYFPM